MKIVWGTDPIVCTRCGEKMGIVTFIEDQAVIRKILTHLDLRAVSERPPSNSLLRDLDDYDIAS
jgi:hypothetical protein